MFGTLIDTLITDLSERGFNDVPRELAASDVLLAMTRGTAVRPEDTYNAWALWKSSTLPAQSPEILPFSRIPEFDRSQYTHIAEAVSSLAKSM